MVAGRVPRRSTIQPGTSAAQRDYPVRSPSELRAALGTIAAATSRDTATARRRGSSTITVTRSFVTTSTFVIPTQCTGVTIRSAGKNAIIARGVVASLFEIRARDVSLRELRCQSPSTADMFTAFAVIGSVADAPDAAQPSLIDNVVEADRLYVEPTGATSTDALLRGNRQTEVNGAHSASIEIHTARARVGDGNIIADGGGDSITLGAGAQDCTVVGNDCGGGDITTTASNGGNTVGINTRTGTITLHADDVEVGNPGAANEIEFTVLVKTADESRTATIVLADDAELVVPVVSGTRYVIRSVIRFSAAIVPDFSWGLAGPATSFLAIRHSHQAGASAAALTITTVNTFPSGVNDAGVGLDNCGVVEFEIDMVPSASGNFSFQWCQQTSDATASRVHAGSYIEYAAVP